MNRYNHNHNHNQRKEKNKPEMVFPSMPNVSNQINEKKTSMDFAEKAKKEKQDTQITNENTHNDGLLKITLDKNRIIMDYPSDYVHVMGTGTDAGIDKSKEGEIDCDALYKMIANWDMYKKNYIDLYGEEAYEKMYGYGSSHGMTQNEELDDEEMDSHYDDYYEWDD